MHKGGISVRLFGALLVTAALGAPVSAQLQLGGTANWLPKLDPLLQGSASLLTGRSPVIVRVVNAPSLGLVQQLILLTGGSLGRTLGTINGQAANIPNASLPILAASSLVLHISSDRPIFGSMERTGATVGATAVRQETGYDGTGIGVAVIDSGVTSWHDDLADPAGAAMRVDQFVDLVNGRTAPYDDYGHGTHVSGIIAGNGFDSGGARSGIAPGAHLIELKTLDGSGQGRISDVIAALAYVINQKDAYNIRVVNLSIGAAVSESYDVDPLTLAAKVAVSSGIVVVAAAGNNGRNAQLNTQYGGINSPGNAPWVLTVGASNHMGTIDRSDDTIAPFSSRGPSAIDYGAKPDIVAPGVGIESLSDPDSFFYRTYSQYLLSGTVATSYLPYISLSGTSMSTPVVTGTVALMLQANPALTPNAVKAILQYTAQTYAGYDALTQGSGFLNAQGAVELAQFFAAPGSAYPSSPDWSAHLIWGNHMISGGQLTAEANAWSTNVTWGAAPVPFGPSVQWGVICTSGNCAADGTWSPWGATCSSLTCSQVTWGSADSPDVVAGSACGGSGCQNGGSTAPLGVMTGGSTVVWGNTVVWGSNYDPSAEPVIWGSQ
jgi:serine protease AprX